MFHKLRTYDTTVNVCRRCSLFVEMESHMERLVCGSWMAFQRRGPAGTSSGAHQINSLSSMEQLCQRLSLDLCVNIYLRIMTGCGAASGWSPPRLRVQPKPSSRNNSSSNPHTCALIISRIVERQRTEQGFGLD